MRKSEIQGFAKPRTGIIAKVARKMLKSHRFEFMASRLWKLSYDSVYFEDGGYSF